MRQSCDVFSLSVCVRQCSFLRHRKQLTGRSPKLHLLAALMTAPISGACFPRKHRDPRHSGGNTPVNLGSAKTPQVPKRLRGKDDYMAISGAALLLLAPDTERTPRA